MITAPTKESPILMSQLYLLSMRTNKNASSKIRVVIKEIWPVQKPITNNPRLAVIPWLNF